MESPPEKTARSHPLLHLGHPDHHIPFFETPEEASKPVKHSTLIAGLLLALALAAAGWGLGHYGERATPASVHGAWVLPFALLLFCIATMPFIAKHFWEHHYPKVAIGLGLLVAVYYTLSLRAPENVAKSLNEYVSFVILLGSLFTISGGILIRVRRRATPLVNTTLLLTGAILANVFGTTGAAMLLIRPFLRMNKGHLKPFHVVFFIFIIANVGGALTPVGDPPLFLGYLKGVPFWWVLELCWPAWSAAIGILLAVFFVLDTVEHRKTHRPHHLEHGFGPAFSIFGASNLVFISLVLAAVFLDSPFREGLMVVAAFGSLWTTPQRIHDENYFNFAPIKEVAIFFIGIFLTMVPALDYLSTHANDAAFKSLLNTPGQYYFSTGALSSVLDNAPTYVTFLESELGKIDPKLKERVAAIVRRPGVPVPEPTDLADLSPEETKEVQAACEAIDKYHAAQARAGTLESEKIEVAFLLANPQLEFYLMAISLGAVFFGACTYIGNGPNFMVKSIAEHAGAQCPSFFGYIFRYTLPVLLPTLIVVWWIFLRGGTL